MSKHDPLVEMLAEQFGVATEKMKSEIEKYLAHVMENLEKAVHPRLDAMDNMLTGRTATKSLLRKTSSAQLSGTFEFCMSDQTRDRHGDEIVASGWDLAEFKRNPIALANHDPSFVIGKWTNIRVEGGRLLGHLQLAPEGTSQRIDEVSKLVRAGFLKSCSVGFIPIDYEELPSGGRRYKKQRLIECSVVSTPSNPSALTTEKARKLGVSETVIQRILNSPPVNGSLVQRQTFARARLAQNKKLLADIEQRRKQAEQTKRAEQAKRNRIMDADTRRDQELVDAFKKGTAAGLAKLTEQHAADETRATKKNAINDMVRRSQFEQRFKQLVDQGADPQELMRNLLNRLK